ncbi:glutathione S-transferase family protein [Maricurvus nonylphenolicus]|uniref:glutathione S-transferase family protein n=1 Tax=Maricurvus nonylphenolicus TaxID=1008307 RepID=UPI0036F23158
MITVYQFSSSPLCEKVRRILNFKGVEFEIQEVPRPLAAQYKDVSPFGKFPAIRDGETPVCDSTDIAYYLEEKYPEKALIPADEKLKAQMHITEDWADESLYFYEMTMRLAWEDNLRRNMKKMMATMPPHLSEEQAMSLILMGSQQLSAAVGLGRKTREQVVEDARRHVVSIAARVENGGWLVGDQITLADLAVIAQFRCLLDALEVQEMVKDYPAITEWMARVDEVAPA